MPQALRLDNGPKPSPAQLQAMVDAFQKAAKTSLPISVVNSPSEIDGIPVNIAPGSVPTGGVVGGRIYLFTENLRTRGELFMTIFHELFHYVLQNVVPAGQYVALMRCVASNSMVPRHMTQWKDSNSPAQAYMRAEMTLVPRVTPQAAPQTKARLQHGFLQKPLRPDRYGCRLRAFADF